MCKPFLHFKGSTLTHNITVEKHIPFVSIHIFKNQGQGFAAFYNGQNILGKNMGKI